VLLFGNNLDPEALLAVIIALTIGMTVHEFAHNYVAHIMGDPTPKQLGRLTLNPLVHINWVGWLMFVIIGFGVLGSAPISPYRMPRENRRWRWFAAVAAGPVSNLLVAVVFGLIFRLMNIGPAGGLVFTLLFYMVVFNCILFLFNLLPLSPIDGWQMVYAVLPPHLAVVWERYQSTTQLIFFGLILLSFTRIIDPLGWLVFQPAIQLATALLTGGRF
jgi:Zn-dependent protease